MNHTLALACAIAMSFGASVEASAQMNNVVKVGVARYATDSRSSGISGIGVPPGADAESGDATTVILEYERELTSNLAMVFAIGAPPKVKVRATGSIAFLGDEILSARNVSPVLGLRWYFGAPGDKWRPYVGAGVHYTVFTDVESRLASNVEMGDAAGWAVKAGVDYALTREWGLFAGIGALKVKSKVVATGATVLQATIDFRPAVYSFGTTYRF
jgi:outer membrane protein